SLTLSRFDASSYTSLICSSSLLLLLRTAPSPHSLPTRRSSDLEEIEIFIFEAGETYRFIESAITMRRDNDIEAFHKDIESNTVQSKHYKRQTAWSKKLYDYAKLNNFAYTFVIADNK